MVKRIFDVDVKEMNKLQDLNDKNIVRYFAYYLDDEFIFIACERAGESLEKYISNVNIKEMELIKVIYESCLGLAYLHSNDILHGNIKPNNILISFLDNNRQRRGMIGDFGLGKSLNMTQSSGFLVKATLDWFSPEALKAILSDKNFKATEPIDIFPMGCVIYYALTRGEHPFGEKMGREDNILKGNHKLASLKSDEKLIYYSLIESMISLEASRRPLIEAVTIHPMFWSGEKKLRFFTTVGNLLNVKNEDTKLLVEELNNNKNNIYKESDWREKMSTNVRREINNSKYNYKNSVTEIIRFIRDKDQHIQEWKKLLGETDQDYMEYFTSRFPTLLIYTYIIMQKINAEPKLDDYYTSYYKFELPKNV